MPPTSSFLGDQKGRSASSSNKREKKTKKRICPQGDQCKYQNEYQHQLEFDHSTTTSISPDKKRKQQDHHSTSISAFSGRGYTLRTFSSSSFDATWRGDHRKKSTSKKSKEETNSDIIEILDASPNKASESIIDLCDTDDEETQKVVHVPNNTKSKRSKNYTNIRPWVAVQLSEEEQMARAIAESNRAVIQQQDHEYYESLWHDQQKEHQKMSKEEQQVQQQQQLSAKSILTEESRDGNDKGISGQKLKPPPVSQNCCHGVDPIESNDSVERKQPASDTKVLLEEEPSDDKENVTKIAFRMPCSYASSQKRIVRKFLNKSTARQLYLFIATLLENASDWRLHQVIGGGELPDSNEQTLEDLGLAPHGVVLVRFVT